MRIPPTTATRRTWDPTSMRAPARKVGALGCRPPPVVASNPRSSAITRVCRGCQRTSAATMPRMKNSALLLVVSLLGACTAAPQPVNPDSMLHSLVEEYFDAQLELSPMSATAIGDYRFDDRLDESAGFREKALGIERAFL